MFFSHGRLSLQLDAFAKLSPLSPYCRCTLAAAKSSMCGDAVKLVFPPSLLQCATGNHFSTAKELTEEIRSLTSEREALEGLLDKLRALSSRNVQKLGGVKEDYSRLRRQLDEGETAYGKQSQPWPGEIFTLLMVLWGSAGCSGPRVSITVKGILEHGTLFLEDFVFWQEPWQMG